MGQILLVRHGQASLLADEYDRLSDLGWTQARRTGVALAARGVRPALLVAGSLRRQQETARGMAAAAGWDMAPACDPDFDEYRHLDLFGTLCPELDSHAALIGRVRDLPAPRRAFHDLFEAGFTAWVGGAVAPGGLSWQAFQDRAIAALARIAQQCDSGQVAVVATSGGVLATLAGRLLSVPDTALLALHNPLRNAGITRVLTRGGSMALAGFNEIGHLEDPAAPDLLSYR